MAMGNRLSAVSNTLKQQNANIRYIYRKTGNYGKFWKLALAARFFATETKAS